MKTCARETLTVAGFSLYGKRDGLYVGAAKTTTSSLPPRSTVASTRPRPLNCASTLPKNAAASPCQSIGAILFFN
jgi:hypothetical protein